MDLIKELESYNPFNEQESLDKEFIISFLKNNPNAFSRENVVAHITASAWVLNKEKTKTVMAFHRIYNSWSWLGGHADNELDLKKVVLKEVNEESGLNNIHLLSNDIFSIEVLNVNGHIKNGKYVSSHLHLNITYLVEASEDDKLQNKEDENTNVKWFSLNDAINASSEEWMKENIYKKLVDKVNKMKG